MGLMWVLPLLFLIVIVALVARSSWWSRGETRGETAREILQRRYASGEITKEQFEDMKRTLGH